MRCRARLVYEAYTIKPTLLDKRVHRGQRPYAGPGPSLSACRWSLCHFTSVVSIKTQIAVF